MKKILVSLLHRYGWAMLFAASALASCQPSEPRVLVFAKTKGWQHASVPAGMAAIQKLGRENKFEVDTTRDAARFNDDDLEEYRAVIFLSTTGNVLNAEQQAAFERYIQAGGGYVGIHAAADTEYEWGWYGELVGAYFVSHPRMPDIRPATVQVGDTSHLATKGLPARWQRSDEWYNYKTFYPDLHVLARLDENTYDGGTHGSDHPIAWYHEFDGGRAFYTGGGHTEESYSEPLFLRHLLGGIRYAMGDSMPDYAKARAVAIPEESRFVKTVLVNDLDTPMELAVSADGEIFFTELRTGNLMLYNTRTARFSIVHRFKLVTKGGTGLIGVTLDPAFATNRFLYLYYSPPATQEPFLFNLSRFTLRPDNTLDTLSEKVLLQVPVQANSGAHHGGSLAWDKEGNLYLSTGDSSSPFPANGYAPLDERPGAEFYALDAQRGASNTNDLKGKVLRIHPEPDGTYTIPEGNLFAKGAAKTRPEIFVMGCRNPYRIAVNPRTSVLYWGEIGPDAGKDSIQGPRGYDEFNQAKKAGNYGWPYFVGNNFAYTKWNFADSTAGPLFDAAAPVNNSPNNTGLASLPPATPAMIWYPYASSKEFPELGLGGRSAMAGAFYTFTDKASEKRFPEYFDGGLFVFDWMRNWVRVLRFDQQENYVRSESFMAATGDFRRPIDMTFGKDGVLYMLEYGSVYGANNDDARLVKIEYHAGNRAPIAMAGIQDSVALATVRKRAFLTSELKNVAALKTIAGAAPLRVTFSSAGSRDPDDDDTLTYQWMFEGNTVGSTKPQPTHTYEKPGLYRALLRVTDGAGATDVDTVLVAVGNDPPRIDITTPDNRSFFWEQKPFRYAVVVADTEDGNGDPRHLKVTYQYNPSQAALPMGYTLMAGSDCKACHTADKVSVGPSYRAVAERYKAQPDAVEKLARKIIEGGGGSWGTEHVMSAHPQLTLADSREIVAYILSLADGHGKPTTLPAKGSLALRQHAPDDPLGVYTIRATYTDAGHGSMAPQVRHDVVALRSAKVPMLQMDAYKGIQRFGAFLTPADHKDYAMLKKIDLAGISQLVFEYASENHNGEIEVRVDSQAGPVIGKATFCTTGGWNKLATATATLLPVDPGPHDIYFYFIKRDVPNKDLISLKSVTFGRN